jgi:sec-independent protein translocase protein TatA
MVGGTMIGELGLPELLLILCIALLIFGPGKLASVGKSLGEAIRGFKSALNEPRKDEEKRDKQSE